VARSWVGRSAVLRHTKPNRSPLNCLPARAAPTTPRLRPSYFQPVPSTSCTPSRSIERDYPLISAAHVTDVWRPGERSCLASRAGGMCRIREVFSAAGSMTNWCKTGSSTHGAPRMGGLTSRGSEATGDDARFSRFVSARETRLTPSLPRGHQLPVREQEVNVARTCLGRSVVSLNVSRAIQRPAGESLTSQGL